MTDNITTREFKNTFSVITHVEQIRDLFTPEDLALLTQSIKTGGNNPYLKDQADPTFSFLLKILSGLTSYEISPAGFTREALVSQFSIEELTREGHDLVLDFCTRTGLITQLEKTGDVTIYRIDPEVQNHIIEVFRDSPGYEGTYRE